VRLLAVAIASLEPLRDHLADLEGEYLLRHYPVNKHLRIHRWTCESVIIWNKKKKMSDAKKDKTSSSSKAKRENGDEGGHIKFSKQFRTHMITAWRPFYFDYIMLRGILNDYSGSAEGEEKQMQKAFFSALEQEVDKVESFYKSVCDYHDSLAKEVVFEFYARGPSGVHAQGKAQELSKTMTDIEKNLRLLKDYVALNKVALRNILRKHDRLSQCYTKLVVISKIEAQRAFYLSVQLNQLYHNVQGYVAEMRRFSLGVNSTLLI
jgi:hypothetical protein